MRTRRRGFLLVAVLLVVSALGVVMLSSTMQDAAFVLHEIAQAQAAYRVPLWDLHDIEPVQGSLLLR